jgi:hypothetical protein
VVASAEFARQRHDLVGEVYSKLARTGAAGASQPPFGVEACRPALTKIIEYGAQ